MISDKTVEKLLGVLSRDIAQRTPGTGDFPTAVEGLQLFRRNETVINHQIIPGTASDRNRISLQDKTRRPTW